MKKEYDKMLNMNVSKLILILSIPAIVSNLISNIYNLVDTYFVGTLGVFASGAVGIIFTLMSLMQAFAYMFGQGGGTNISLFLANHEEDKASFFASVSYFSSLILGAFFMLFGLIFIEPLMYLLGSTDTILIYAKKYGTMILLSAPAIMTSLVINNIFRYEGKTYLGMIGLSFGGILNIILDAFFVNVINLGVFGVGLATCISQYSSSIILLILMFKKSVCHLSFKYFLKGKKQFLKIIKNGFPSFMRQCLNTLSSGLINNVAGNYGDECIATISICNRLQGFMFSIGLGIGQAFQPVAAFNYQKEKIVRLKKAYFFTFFSSLSIFLIFSFLSFIFASRLIAIFLDGESTSNIISLGATTLKFICVGLCFLPFSVTTNMLYQSTGKSLIASILASLRGGLCSIPYILILPLFFGVFGLQLGICLGDITAALISIPFAIFYFKKIKNLSNIKAKKL